MLAGHGGDAVTWMGEHARRLGDVAAFTRAAPVPGGQGVRSTPIRSIGRFRQDLEPPCCRRRRYTGRDDGAGEAPPRGWTPTFPHVLNGDNDETPDAIVPRPVGSAARSPTPIVGRFAAALVEALQLGTHEATDLLAISFSTPDLVGHAFGPRSQEVAGHLRAPRSRRSARCFDELDAQVGKGR